MAWLEKRIAGVLPDALRASRLNPMTAFSVEQSCQTCNALYRFGNPAPTAMPEQSGHRGTGNGNARPLPAAPDHSLRASLLALFRVRSFGQRWSFPTPLDRAPGLLIAACEGALLRCVRRRYAAHGEHVGVDHLSDGRLIALTFLVAETKQPKLGNPPALRSGLEKAFRVPASSNGRAGF